MNRKSILRLWPVFGFLLGFFIWFSIGHTAPHLEHFKIGARDYVLGDNGNSVVGTKEIAARDTIPPVVRQVYSQPAPRGLLSTLRSLVSSGPRTLTLAYTCVAQAVVVNKIVPDFQKYWYEKTGEEVNFVTGYALPDFDTLATTVSGNPVQLLLMASSTNTESRGYGPTKWQESPNQGIVFSIPQVFLVRKGNPLGLKTFADLAIPGVRVVHVNPILGNGTGMYPVWGIYGSALKESELATGEKDYAAAGERLKKVEDNAFSESTDLPTTIRAFLAGFGDVFVIPENAALNVVQNNDSVKIVVPPYTIINDFSIYKMEQNIGYTDQDLADAFVDYLFSPEIQEDAAGLGYRPSDPSIMANHPEFRKLVKPFHMSFLGEPTEAKKRVLLEKFVSINNNKGNE